MHIPNQQPSFSPTSSHYDLLYSFSGLCIWFLIPSKQQHTITYTGSFVDVCLSLHSVLVFPASCQNDLCLFTPSPASSVYDSRPAHFAVIGHNPSYHPLGQDLRENGKLYETDLNSNCWEDFRSSVPANPALYGLVLTKWRRLSYGCDGWTDVPRRFCAFCIPRTIFSFLYWPCTVLAELFFAKRISAEHSTQSTMQGAIF